MVGSHCSRDNPTGLTAMAANADTGYQLVSALFLRLLGVIYLIAFASLGLQV
jgi:hypothetical protein